MKNTLRIFATAAMMMVAQFATAAHITIDDTDVDDVTISWVHFEGGFKVNGTSYGSAGSLTLTDVSSTPLTFEGLWTDLDANADSMDFDLGSNPGAPGDITSALGFDIFDNDPSSYAKIAGDFLAYNAFTYFTGPNSYFQGDSLGYSASYLTFSYHSEAGESTVPAPPALALFGLALLGLGIRRQQQQ